MSLSNPTLRISCCWLTRGDCMTEDGVISGGLLDLGLPSRLRDLKQNVTLNKHHKCHQTMLWTGVKLQSEAGPQSSGNISRLCFARKPLLYYGIFERFNRFGRRMKCIVVRACFCVRAVERRMFVGLDWKSVRDYVRTSVFCVSVVGGKMEWGSLSEVCGSPALSVCILFKCRSRASSCHLTFQYPWPLSTSEPNSQPLSALSSPSLSFTKGYLSVPSLCNHGYTTPPGPLPFFSFFIYLFFFYKLYSELLSQMLFL